MDASMEEASRHVRRERVHYHVADHGTCHDAGDRLLSSCSASFRIFSSFEIELCSRAMELYVYSTKIVDLRGRSRAGQSAAALASIILVFLAAFIPIPAQVDHAPQFTTVTGHSKPKTSISAHGVIRRRPLLLWLFLSWTWCRS